MKIALIGNQNSGKTTLFNVLTGLNQKIGNWPGVTIDKKSGIVKGTDYELVDLPGIYSLTSYTSEEEITRNFLIQEKPDLVINIIDATQLERSLYLTTQLLEFDQNIVLALNMSDIIEKKGYKIDEGKLQELLGLDIIKISAHKKTGIDNLITAIKANRQREKTKGIFPKEIQSEIEKIENLIQVDNKRFVAIKLLEGIGKDLATVEDSVLQDAVARLETAFDTDIEEIIAHARYDYIVELKEQVLFAKREKLSITDKLDKVFLNKWIALPIFAIIMFLIYYISVGAIGSLTTDFLEGAFESFGEWFGEKLSAANASDWAVSLVADGIWGGVSAVIVFVPQLFVLFLCLSLLETTGYMARISFLLDKIFRHFGLSGKTIIPFIVGSGCSVPGIMATRTIEDEREKSMAIMLTPFVPCSAKLPIIALFSSYFFPQTKGLVSASVYLFAIVVIFLSALLFKLVSKKTTESNYIAELPEYKIPSLRYVARDVSSKTKGFIVNAGTLILIGSVVVWFLGSFTWRFQYGMGIENSMLKSIGNVFAWLFYPMLGEWSWTATVSAIQGFVAKEQVVSTMSIIANLSSEGASVFQSSAFAFFTPASAYAFIVFNLFSVPCVAAVSAMRKEYRNAKKTLLALGFQMIIAFILSYIVFGVGSLIEVIL